MQNKINDFLFSPVNPKIIIIFRVLIAGMLSFMFAPKGLAPKFPLTNFPEIIPYLFSTEYYVLIFALIVLFAVGIKPRLIAFILFLVLLPHNFLSEGVRSKQVILIVLFCFIFIKSLPVWKLGKTQYDSSGYGPMWPIRLIQFQLTCLYGINAIVKSNYHYLSGEALSNMSVALNQFQVDLSDGYMHLAVISIPVYIAAISTVILEYWLAIGFWFKKTRWATAFIGILFHIALTFIISIFMLDYISMFLYLSFLLPFQLKAKS